MANSKSACDRLNEGDRQVVMGLSSREKDDLSPRCLFWEGYRMNAGAAVLLLLAGPHPTNSTLPPPWRSPHSRWASDVFHLT